MNGIHKMHGGKTKKKIIRGKRKEKKRKKRKEKKEKKRKKR